ncbi:hypothetical protein DFH09DRAFT_1303960 [Mycena vulgaris]|nr:hypothetical protein DFH09DRAFT_1303960 [Mycena vulgaris]
MQAEGRASKRLKVTSENAAASSGFNADAAAPSSENTLTEMPLDIILRLLQVMSPAELLAMRDVNKGFRSMLDSGEKAKSIWVQSREYHGIPKPFEGFDELAWARFIFGSICQESREPDFGLMMRVCTDCRRYNLVQEIDFSVHSDEEDFSGPILEFEDTFPHSKWYISRDELFAEGRKPDKQWWAPYCFDILPLVRDERHGVRGAQKKLDKLDKEGQRRLEYAILCDKWRDGMEAEERRAKQEILNGKFKTLGYRDPELDGLNDRKMLAGFDLPLTEDAWTILRESLESSIKDKRRSRLLKDHLDIMKARQNLAREAYMAYAATVLPKEATNLPTHAGLEAIPEIRVICELEPDVSVTVADFSDLPSVIADWVSNKRARLTQLANSDVTGKTTDRFNLASTIFRCKTDHGKTGRPAMFGGDEAMRHVGQTCDPHLDKPLSEVASALVISLGLDPNILSVADMDLRDARFRCDGRLDYEACGNRQTADMFTWRGCITHAIEVHQYGDQEQAPSYRRDDYHKRGRVNFALIPAHPEQAHGPFKDDLPKMESTAWVCGHCTKYVCGPETFQGVTVHVKTVYVVTYPGDVY